MKPTNNPTCEAFEASLSALIDGELDAPEQPPVVDHLLECASCQDFYRQCRALSGMVTSAATRTAEPAPPEVWDRIATETGLVDRGTQESSGIRRYLPSAMQIAAGLVLALAIWLLRPVALDSPAPGPSAETGVVDVVLEQDRGSMSDERFLELTTEILRADRGYHRKMLEIMSIVDDMAVRPEGSGDEPLAAPDGLRRTSAGEGENASLWSGDQL